MGGEAQFSLIKYFIGKRLTHEELRAISYLGGVRLAHQSPGLPGHKNTVFSYAK